MYVKRNTETLPATTVAVEKQQVLHILSVFVAFSIQHAMRMPLIICGLSGYTVFFHISHKRHDCWEKQSLNMKCVSIFSTTFV